ncbi:MAG: xylanase, partial [Lachnospiraceae bacterium]|nr:xylanase [Lachnospiraceae bacterium]
MSADTINYRNYFELIGKSQDEVNERINSIFNTFFYGSEEERIYHPAPDDTGYLEDTGNHDART